MVHVNAIELAIVEHILEKALSQGYLVSVYNDSEISPYALELALCDDRQHILDHMFTTGHDTLVFSLKEDYNQNCWVHLIYGNNCDVLHDYLVNAHSEKILNTVDDFIDKLVEA